jgi:flagellar motility protein MotE (MotC chaperone)
MRVAVLLLTCLAVILVVGAIALYQRGLLSAEVARMWLPQEKKGKETAQVAAPVGLAAALEEKERLIEQQRRESEQVAERVNQQKQELEVEMAKLDEQLETLQKEAEARGETAAGNARVSELVKIYEGMEPEEAAAILENLPDEQVADILLRMRRRQAAQVMQSLSTEKGVTVSAHILPETLGNVELANLHGEEVN